MLSRLRSITLRKCRGTVAFFIGLGMLGVSAGCSNGPINQWQELSPCGEIHPLTVQWLALQRPPRSNLVIGIFRVGYIPSFGAFKSEEESLTEESATAHVLVMRGSAGDSLVKRITVTMITPKTWKLKIVPLSGPSSTVACTVQPQGSFVAAEHRIHAIAQQGGPRPFMVRIVNDLAMPITVRNCFTASCSETQLSLSLAPGSSGFEPEQADGIFRPDRVIGGDGAVLGCFPFLFSQMPSHVVTVRASERLPCGSSHGAVGRVPAWPSNT